MHDAEYQRQESSFGDDGELLSAVFCTDCGSVNEPDVEHCLTCNAVLTEQGNHLSARLRRISRRGRAGGIAPEQESDVIGDNWTMDGELRETSISKLGTWMIMLGVGAWPIPLTLVFVLGTVITLIVVVLKMLILR